MKTEPVLTIYGQIQALVVGLVTLVVAFGVDLTNEQTGAIVGVSAIAIGLISAVIARGQVSPYEGDALPPHGHLELDE
jgi:hypothetical protein